MCSQKRRENLQFVAYVNVKDSPAPFSNNMLKVRKQPPDNSAAAQQKYQNIWYLKDILGDFNYFPWLEVHAVLETLAQELFRLFIPYQPKVRHVIQQERDEDDIDPFLTFNHVMCKQVCPGTSLFEVSRETLREGLLRGVYTGLGRILVMALFVMEADLKEGNLLLDRYNRIVKIDGDHCFSSVIMHSDAIRFTITATDLDNLPFINDFKPHNWLDIIMSTEQCISKIIDPRLTLNPIFRSEVNQTLLSILVFPSELMWTFIDACVHPYFKHYKLSDLVIERMQMLKAAAIQNKSFQKYLLDKVSGNDLTAFIKQIKAFTVTGKQRLPVEIYENLFHLNYQILRKQVKKIQSKSRVPASFLSFFKSGKTDPKETKNKHGKLFRFYTQLM